MSNFIKKKLTGSGVLTSIAAFATILYVIEQFNSRYWELPNIHPLVWTATLVAAIYLFVVLLTYCWFTQDEKQEEIDRIAEHNAKLQVELMNKDSSKNLPQR